MRENVDVWSFVVHFHISGWKSLSFVWKNPSIWSLNCLNLTESRLSTSIYKRETL